MSCKFPPDQYEQRLYCYPLVTDYVLLTVLGHKPQDLRINLLGIRGAQEVSTTLNRHEFRIRGIHK